MEQLMKDACALTVLNDSAGQILASADMVMRHAQMEHGAYV
jgi:hypothetical protein